MRLRTQLVLVTVLISCALTGVSLFVVRQSVRAEFRRRSSEAGRASVRSFQSIDREREADLVRTAALLSELPTLKAVMTTEHAATIQDASLQFWNLSGTDLFVLTSPAHERVLAVHSTSQPPSSESIERSLLSNARPENAASWWQNGRNLFQIVEHPIVAGSGTEQHVLGAIVVGRRISNAVAQQIGHFAGSEIALASNSSVVASTLDAKGKGELEAILAHSSSLSSSNVDVNGQPYEMSEISLDTDSSTPLRCYILFPLQSSYAFLEHLNRMILVLGILVAGAGALIVSVIAHAMTVPLDRLVKAVRALATGDYSYSIDPGGSTEVAALAHDFASMRHQLTDLQKRRVEAERMAALGRAAGSISHDLRHHLAVVVANAEFLHDAEQLGFNRNEVYAEIQRASAQMTTLIDSLLEVSRERVSLTVEDGDLKGIVTRAANAVRSNPAFRNRHIEVRADVPTNGMFDSSKLERAFVNLLQNACEATDEAARVGVTIGGSDSFLECLVWDTGSGIPDSIRNSVFEPFVSAGKNNGTGLGLAITAKIVHDHGGVIRIDQTSPGGTTFRVCIPRRCESVLSDATGAVA